MTYAFACITGASSGIGSAFARALPPETSLLLTGRDRAALAALADDLAAPGRRVETLSADLASESGRRALIAAAAKVPLDLLVQNAGLGAYGPLVVNAPEAEREMVEVNVLAPVVLTRALLPHMLAQAERTGRRAGLVVVASTASFAPLPYFVTYAASKAFGLSYAEGLAGELHDRPADVVAVCPGPTRTDFFRRAKALGLQGWGMDDPETVARAALGALGRRTVVSVGARNRAYRSALGLLPRRVLRPAIRAAMQRGLKHRSDA